MFMCCTNWLWCVLWCVQVTVEEQSRVMNICQKVRTGVLFMIDLAGSERAANTQVCGYFTRHTHTHTCMMPW